MDVKSLIAQRGICKGKITRFRDFLNKELLTQGELELRIKRFEPLLDIFEQLQDKIEVLDPTQDAERSDFENDFFVVLANAKEKLTMNKSAIQTNSNIKLPIIELPTFRGDYCQWIEFRDAFISLVDGNHNLDAVQKFYYLRSCLKGEALKLITALPMHIDNYVTAWEMLTDRYENSKIIINNHVNALFKLPDVKAENHVAIRNLLDEAQLHLKSLNNLNIATKNWDVVLIYLLSNKLDSNTRAHWEQYPTKNKLPTYEEFIKCLYARAQVLEASANNEKRINPGKTNPHNYKKEVMVSLSAQNSKCLHCNGNHRIYYCRKFLELKPKERIDKIHRLGACLKCLNPGHKLKDCKSKFNCRKCDGENHNTLLHFKKPEDSKHERASSSSAKEAPLVSNHAAKVEQNFVLLSTAIINIKNNLGNSIQARVLLDSGAQSNFISEEFANKLNLKVKKANIPVTGIHNKILNIKSKVELNITSSYSEYERKIECLILPEVTGNLPQISFQKKDAGIPSGLQLADPNFNITSSIDLLLGAEIFWEVLHTDRIRIGDAGLTLQRTELGWLVSGPISTPKQKRPVNCNLSLNLLHKQLESFWKIEELAPVKHRSHEERACEESFLHTHQRDEKGRFAVRLPLRPNINQMGETLKVAEKRFYNMERKFLTNKDLMLEYKKFMKEYQDLGHMTLCEAPPKDKISYYLPHHAVMKESSTTTKTRVVFDGSAKSSTGISLNDALMVGPVLQKDLCAQLLFFRKHQYALTADIEKMYRQILVQPEDRDLQRIVWRDAPEEEIRHYQLNTVTYGLGPSSFLATRCLEQLGTENQEAYRKVSRILKYNFYMDDLITGDENEADCLLIKHQLNSILASAGMNLRKWRSNLPSISSKPESDTDMIITDDPKEKKILGLSWNNQQDYFQYIVKPLETCVKSKRQMLSCIASTFDPLGLIGPITLVAKLIMQGLWQTKIQWDEDVPSDQMNAWNSYINELPLLNDLKIPRKIICKNHVKLHLHGFCDSSEKAYAACIYIVSTDESGNTTSNLVTSKSRVAPLKSISLPKLELCGAVLLIKLVNYVKIAMNLDEIDTTYWCDSMITLCWIRGQPARWNTFVANRVAEIQESSQPEHWKHVRSEDNAADVLSRGARVSQLLRSDLWWHGPTWLTSGDYPKTSSEATPLDLPEERLKLTLISAVKQDWEIFSRYSCLTKLQRVTAYILRFIFNCRNSVSRRGGALTVYELENSLHILISRAQCFAFPEETRALQAGCSVKNGSRLKSLNPYLFKDLIRVGGRLSNGKMISESQQHPIVLPSQHKLSELIVRHYHYLYLHAGTQALLALIRMRYWPIMGKNLIKKILKYCIICFRCNPKTEQQLMADLPAERITECRPFQLTGVDYCGPIMIKSGVSRKTHSVKSYLCLFICMVSKAIHLELVMSLSTDSFLNAFKRFISRRGKPSKMFSDNATNFRGANNELREIYKFMESSNEKIDKYLANLSIQWQFIPPRAPHFGGLWEAGVKSVKYHLKRVANASLLTYEEFSTVLCQIESCLNSRPLCPLSNDPKDLNSLSPGHFLIGTSLAAIPEQNLQNVAINRLNHYQKLTQLIQSFWSRWRKEYLAELQTRTKWTGSHHSQLQPGQMVILKEDNEPPCFWRLGRVHAVHPGPDGRVRVATIITAQGTVQRAISKLCLLPIEDNNCRDPLPKTDQGE